jgi:protein TonB
MDFDSWNRSGVDTRRVKRLLIGYVIGAASVAAGSSFIFLTSKGASAEQEEDPAIEAQLVSEPEPEPEPEPPPPVEQEKPKPRPPKVVTPLEIPKEAPKEAEVKAPLPEDEDPFAEKEAPAPSAAPAVVEAPKPPPPKREQPLKPKGPMRVTEDVTPPAPLSQTQPELPASAKAAGIDGVVTVKYVVSETGMVTEAKVLRGPPELHAVCLAAVKSWRFKPALLDGKPVAVVRMYRFRFRIKT